MLEAGIMGIMGIMGIILVPRLTSKGTKAPHAFTFHADCNSSMQNMAMRSKVMRVKSGRRKTYFWILAGLNWGSVGAIEGDVLATCHLTVRKKNGCSVRTLISILQMLTLKTFVDVK